MKKLWFLLVIPALLLLWWAADRKDAVPSVRYVAAKRETIESIVSTNGRLEPVDFAETRAEVAGVVQDVKVERGNNVTKGQTLVTLDNATQRAAVDTAAAQLEEARAEESTARQGGKLSVVTDFEGKLKAAQLAQQDAERRLESARRLYAKQAATREEVKNAESAAASARQQVEAIQAGQKSLVAPSDLETTAAKLRDAKANLALAQHRLALTTIAAPMNGTLYQFDLKRGNFLEIGAVVGVIGNLDQMLVRVYVDEPDLGRVSLGLPVDISWQAQPGRKWQGRVTQIPTEVTALGTRQVGVVTCVIDNPNHELLPGTNIDASIISKVVKDAVSVPKQALQVTDKGAGVWKLNGDRITWQPAVSGVSNITDVEIKSGLKEGERVILPSDATLSDGMHVNAQADDSGRR